MESGETVVEHQPNVPTIGSVPTIRVQTLIDAPAQACFDAARDVDLHVRSASATGERAVGGVTTGQLTLGDEVTWEARHLGVRQKLTARITRFDPPHLFEDVMVQGPFRSFRHVHEFRPSGPERDSTMLVDTVTFESPFGPLGWLADHLFLKRYLRRFLEQRARFLKQVLESGGRRYTDRRSVLR